MDKDYYLKRIAEALERIDDTLADMNNEGVLTFTKPVKEEEE